MAVTAVRDAIAVIRTNLPFLVNLSDDERRTRPKLGDNRLALVEDAHMLMGAHPDDVPAFVSLPELERDRALRAQLDDIRLALEALHGDVEGTERCSAARC